MLIMKSTTLRGLVAVGLGVLFAPEGSAAADSEGATKSPPAGAAPAPAASVPPIELRGVIPTPIGQIYRIYDKQTDTASWLRLNEAGPDLVVKGHRLLGGMDQLTVNYRGTDYVLTLKSAGAATANVRPASPKVSIGPKAGADDTLLGVPVSELRPDEMARLQTLLSQIRNRRSREQQAEAESAEKAAP